jgi:hypothetical protein
MATAMKPLANITLGSAASSVTFSSIVGTYRDLVLVVQAGVTSGPTNFRITVNGDSGGNYSVIGFRGNGSSANSYAASGMSIFWASYYDNVPSANTFNSQVNFMDYSATDKHKAVLVRSGDASLDTQGQAMRWANTAAITSLQCVPGSSTWLAGSTFALYGVSA